MFEFLQSLGLVWILAICAVVFLVWGLFQSRQNRQCQQKQPGLVVLEAENQQLRQQNNALTEQIASLYPLQGELKQQSQQVTQLHQQLAQSKQDYQALNEQLRQAQSELASVNSRLESERQSADEKLALLHSAKDMLMQEFKVLSNDILEQKQQQMGLQSKEAISGLVQPMQASLEQFKARIEQAHKEDLEGRASLTEQLKALRELNQTMSVEANNLTRALKGDQKLQGNWGELILRKLLESSGLREGIEFEVEKSFTQADGTRLRPDVIINLPDNKHVVIDSKVSLLSYEAALNAEDDRVRAQHIKAHLLSLSNHIKALSDKRYDHIEGLNAPDFVLMFIPIEGAYLMAIEDQPAIFEKAFDQRVAVVTPTTLFTTLKTIEQLWRYERQSEHTMNLIKRAADVHDKFVGFVSTFEKIGKQLDLAQASYQTAFKQMTTGKSNLVRQAEMLKDLAGKTKKELPAHLLAATEGEAILEDHTTTEK